MRKLKGSRTRTSTHTHTHTHARRHSCTHTHAHMRAPTHMPPLSDVRLHYDIYISNLALLQNEVTAAVCCVCPRVRYCCVCRYALLCVPICAAVCAAVCADMCCCVFCCVCCCVCCCVTAVHTQGTHTQNALALRILGKHRHSTHIAPNSTHTAHTQHTAHTHTQVRLCATSAAEINPDGSALGRCRLCAVCRVPCAVRCLLCAVCCVLRAVCRVPCVLCV